MLYSANTDVTLETLRETYTVPTIEELIKSKTKKDGTVPDGVGNRWVPLHHASLLEQIESAGRDLGLTLTKTGLDLSKDSHDLFGSMQFDGLAGFDYSDRAPVLGFRHSNLQRFKLMGVTGARMFVCANGQISGTFVFGERHMPGKVASGMGIREGMEKWCRQALAHQAAMNALDTTEITDRDSEHILFEAARENIVPFSQLGKVDAAYKAYLDADNAHHVFAPRTAGSLYQAVTEIGKGWRPQRVLDSLQQFPKLLINELGIDATLSLEADESVMA